MHGGYSAKNGALNAPQLKQSSSGSELGDDLPQVCETCLGPNPYVRMSKLPFGYKLCKISNLPYQAFKWKAGPGGRYKETIISFAVATQRNICQTCLNDMKYGLPVGVRDALLKQPENQIAMPQSNVGQQYFYEQQKQMVDSGQVALANNDITNDLANVVPNRQLDRFARAMQVSEAKSKIAFRNLPKLCSFWMNGSCTRVTRNTCPFRPCCGVFAFPEIAGAAKDLCTALIKRLEAEGPEAVQKTLDAETRSAIQQAGRGNRDDAIRKRVSGEDDLTNKYLGKMKNMNMTLEPPQDPSITTLWLGGVEQDIDEAAIREAIYPYGQVSHINIVRSAKCAFVEYVDRASAENAAAQMYKALLVKGHPLNVNWAKPRNSQLAGSDTANVLTTVGGVMPVPPGMESAPASAYALPGMPAPSTAWPPPPPTTAPPTVAKTGGETNAASVLAVGDVRGRETVVNTNNNNKRQKVDVKPTLKANSLIASLSGYGDDDDDDDGGGGGGAAPIAPSLAQVKGKNSGSNNRNGESRPAAPQYPSMNPSRLGSTAVPVTRK